MVERVPAGLQDFHHFAREAAALLVSFDRFTRQMFELDGVTVLRAWMSPVADDVDRLGIMEHEPDGETLAEWGAVWGSFWNRKMAFEGLASPATTLPQNNNGNIRKIDS